MKVIVTTSEELTAIVNNAVTVAVENLLNATKKEEEAILRRKDVAAMFQVSLVTINQWARAGRIPYYRINSRIFFKKSEIMNLLTQRKSRRGSQDRF